MQILSLLVKCKNCKKEMVFENAHSHACDIKNTSCQEARGDQENTLPSKLDQATESPVTVKKCLSRSISSPLSKAEERLHTHLTRRKLSYAGDASTITCKTKGQVRNILYITISSLKNTIKKR